MSKPDALGGVERIVNEVKILDKTLKPFEHHAPLQRPLELSVRIHNMNPTTTYRIEIYEEVESVKMPNPARNKP